MRRWLLILLPVLMTIWVHLPDLWWNYRVPSGLAFIGQASFVDQIDLSIYFRCIREGMAGSGFMIPNYADSLNQSRMPVYPVYIALGRIGRWFTHSTELVFYGAGVLVGLGLIWIVYWFLGLFIIEKNWRLIGWYGVFLSGGVGWAFFPRIIFPDIGVPIFTLWSALRSPHEGITIICLLLCLGMTYRYFSDFQRRRLGWIAMCLFGLLLNHPQTIVPFGVVGLGYGIFGTVGRNWKKVGWWVLTVIVSMGVYLGAVGRWLLFSSSSIGLRNQGTYVFPLYYWLFASGVVGLLALWGMRQWKTHLFLVWWLVVELCLFYCPLVPYRGMMIRGVWVDIVILAVVGVQSLPVRWTRRAKVVVMGIVILISVGDWLLIAAKRFDQTYMVKRAFVSRVDMDAYRYLQQRGYTGGVVGTYQTMNILLGMTSMTPYAGHNPLTPQFESRFNEVLLFYRNQLSNEEATAWMRARSITWVLWGNPEQKLVNQSQLHYDFLVPVWSQQGVTIYRPSWALQSF